ncbi:MAG TPA: MarR family transcriptional regulator [Syntrophorhabdaceae bacterium]|nr:MarR family transcriptional regulator [Syntrophorhabdaceae bacterium]
MQNPMDLDALIDLRLLLRRTEETIQKARQKELRKYGITTEASAVLHIISDLGGSARLQELSHWLFRKQHTIQELLNRMEKAGLVQRINEPNRKNGVRVALTKQGKDLYRQTKQLRGPRRIFSSLTQEQHTQLKTFLHILLDEAQKELGDKDEVELRPLHNSRPVK